MIKVLVIGLGGIGSIYSLILTLANDVELEVSFVARSNADAVAANGLQINSAKYGKHRIVPKAVYKSSKDATDVYDYVFCTTKSLPSSPSVPSLQPVISSQTCIVLIQNGLSIEEPVHKAFPHNTLISCIAYIGVWQSAPGHIEHSPMERLELAAYPEKAEGSRAEQDQQAIQMLHDILKAGGSDVSIVPSAPAARWAKLIWNASFNTICTITGLDTAGITACPAAKDFVMSAMHEIELAAAAAGYPLPANISQINWDRTAQLVSYKPSMMLDYEARREMEVDVIVEAPIKEAEKYGIQTPTLNYIKKTLDVLNWKIKQ